LKHLVHSRWSPLLAIASALLLLAGAIALTQSELRRELRGQLARRDGNLFALLLRQQLNPDGDGALVDPLAALLDTARLPELPGLRTLSLYDTAGRFSAAIPATAEETILAPEAIEVARTGATYSHLNLHAEVAAETILPSEELAPLLEVVLAIEDPLGGGRSGFARLLLDGSGLAREFSELDANLRHQAWRAFGLAGVAMTLALGFAFRAIHAINRRLRLANAELSLAAKTAAIGAVTSHLLHGLRNPLAGLQHFVSGQSAVDAPEWSDAAETTRRMRRMIDGVMQVLRDDAFASQIEVPLGEVLRSLIGRLADQARARGVEVQLEGGAGCEISGREANLVGLIVENLVTNALQASSRGSVVRVVMETTRLLSRIRVLDTGEGLPAHVRQQLFSPVQSTKAGGSGIGLAISRQIAASIGARLELMRSGPDGTEFSLSLSGPAADPARD
jgi:signal transduction histidine kinase